MKKVIAILFFLVFISLMSFSKGNDRNLPIKAQTSFRITLPKPVKQQIHFYDIKYQMKDQYYFKGDMINWQTIRIKGQFIVPTKWGTITIGIYLPALYPKGIQINL